ncbi:MAG: DUF4860 domain-containing protein [Clostridia bacterium]|nr:DUF4860 domain-containing protein [Clostridia bacterium]
MSTYRAHSALRSVAVFSLCALFAVLAMGLALLSGGVYRSTVSDADRNNASRTALSYLVNQVRRSDEAGCVALTEFGGSDALALTERVDGAEYVTLLYCYDGQLRELYMEKGTGLAPEDGVAVLPLGGLDFSRDGGLLHITVTVEDGTCSAAVTPRSGIGEEGAL